MSLPRPKPEEEPSCPARPVAEEHACLPSPGGEVVLQQFGQQEREREAPTGRPRGGSGPLLCCDHFLGSAAPAAELCLSCGIAMCSLHRQLHARKEAGAGGAEAEPTLPRPQCQREEPGTSVHRSGLESQTAELRARLHLAEELSRRGREEEAEVRAVNARLRERVAQLLEQMAAQVRGYGAAVTELIEADLRRSEEALSGTVCRAEELRGLLSEACTQAHTVLAETDEAAFSRGLRNIQPQLTRLMAEPLGEAADVRLNTKHTCAAIERSNAALREGLGASQRALRVVLNPSEVTLDPNTVHPNLVLSEELKSVTFSTTKQPYPQHRDRFSSFLQALSSQGFSGGQHRWRVETEDCQWLVGVCYRGMARVGVGSALESSPGSWCLMWCDNLLRAYAQGRDTPLKRTTALRAVEIRLDYEAGNLAFYSTGGNQIHLHTFQTSFTEPVHLALRMMSRQPKSRIAVCS
ncbi:tripartite motif-containing protein 14-like [Megalops cyprinoides]|uniref:tripartite motif-containing protein 14-like n=1 Tax=Megalops cyprinoides TaxID=118141 RepID=UPI0018643E9D|nr:tripartite motif-containing protein 14-like [Megalops cyprinoides]